MIGSIFAIVVAGFLAFTLGGGLILRFLGIFFMLGAALELLIGHNASLEISGVIFGLPLWLVGHYAYYLSYGEYRSAVAERLLGLLRLPELEPARRIHASRYHLVHRLRDRAKVRRERRAASGAPVPPRVAAAPRPGGNTC